MNKNLTLGGCFGLILYLVIITPLLAIWNGFVLSKLWTWFVVPLGVNQISIPHAMGISTLVGLFLSGIVLTLAQIKSNMEDKDEDQLLVALMTSFLFGIIVPLLAWGFGAIYHYFIGFLFGAEQSVPKLSPCFSIPI